MPLDDLVQVIDTLKRRISEHGDSLRQNEIRTRVVLIDPLLKALGWDVADPGLVTAEYNVGNGRADYALLVPSDKPAALVEAKHLGEQLESTNHQEQVFTYALMQQVKYAGLTDGNRWVLDDVSDFSGERRKLDVTIANTPSHQCALKFLLLWRPNLASQQPVVANEPAFTDASAQPPSLDPTTNSPAPAPNPTLPPGWISLAEFIPGQYGQVPSLIRFPDGEEKPLRYWNSILMEAAEFLISGSRLTSSQCPVPVPNSTRYAVHHTRIHSDGKEFINSRTLSNGLFCELNASSTSLMAYSRVLLSHCGQDPASVLLKIG